MTLDDQLGELALRLGTSELVALVAADGLPVASVGKSRLDLEMLSAEVVSQIQVVNDNEGEFELGKLRQLVVSTDLYHFGVAAVHDGYFLMAICPVGSPVGRLRFELLRSGHRLHHELA